MLNNKAVSAPTSASESPVMTTLRYIGDSIDLYDSILNRAESQLDHVLTPVPDTKDGSQLYEAGASSMHENLMRMHRRFEQLNARLISILDRSTV